MAERILVLLSGGVDSAVALWMVMHERPLSQVFSLTIDYHRRSRGEIEAAARLAEKAGVSEHLRINLEFLRDLEDQLDITPPPYRGAPLPPVFIPVRNLVFYSCAAHVAYTLGADTIIVGHNSDDVERFPDVGPAFIESFNQLLKESLPGYSVKIEAPLLKHSKREVIQLALRYGVPLEETWSCWGPGDVHCGICEGCLTRRRMFKELGLRDTTLYESVNSHPRDL